MILEGEAEVNNKTARKGDIIEFEPMQEISIKNNYKKPLKYIIIDIPPAKEEDIVWLT